MCMPQPYSERERKLFGEIEGEGNLGEREEREKNRRSVQIWEEMGEKYRGSGI